ncbi:hypothetical protein CSKR_107352 [Clonorchis sinensis]|uniref:Uncharacterized protein n=2 Tax=Clonorchis sinensis TaxID=79923 RepID=A0A8T1N0C9_CLOSI|nr:hypothetical protein CSKR_107352 [Clonorchis sinensis]
MESEPVAAESIETEHIVSQVVVEDNSKMDSSMIEATEPAVHSAELIKADQGNPNGLEQNEEAGSSMTNDSSSCIGKHGDEAQAETDTPQPVSKKDETSTVEQWDDGVPVQRGLQIGLPQDTPVQEKNHVFTAGEHAVDVPLVVAAQKSPATITVCPELPEGEQRVSSLPTETDEISTKLSERLVNGMEVEVSTEQKDEDFTVQKGLAVTQAGQLEVDHSDLILRETDEADKEVLPAVTIDPISGEEIAAELPKPPEEPVVVEQDTQPEIESGLKKSISTSSLEKAANGQKKKRRRFHFSFHRGKEVRQEESKKEGSLDRTSERFFGTNVKHVWENLSKSLKRKEKPAAPAKVKTRPPRPPPVSARVDGKFQLQADELDQQSLQSLSGVSISNSPVVARKHLIQEALPDFMEALPAGSMEVSVGGYNNKENHATDMHVQQGKMFSWNASQIAGTPASEAAIQPTQKQHPYYAADSGVLRGSGSHPSPKPPRPTSPPTLSPLDYQPYHSEDGLSQSDIVQRRLNLVNAMTPSGSEVNVHVRGSVTGARTPSSQVSGDMRPLATSLDRRQQMGIEYRAPTNVRRAQTLRTDYASRLRERVLSLRVEPGETQGDGGTLRPRKLRTKKETYVCSDTIKFPKLSFKLSKRQKEKSPALVHPEKIDMVIPRPQPNFVSSAPDAQRFWVQQQITNNYEPEVCRSEGFLASRPPVKTGPQLTSLISMAGKYYGDGNVQIIPEDSAAQEYDLKMTTYISGEIRGQLEQQTEIEQLQEALRQSQPFLVAWDSRESQNESQQTSPDNLAHIVECIGSFLNTCIRLRSADLQGHFAPFQYQLASFEIRCWKNVARFINWNTLLVVGGPSGTTEYIQIAPAPSTKPEIFCTYRCVDIMLTNWLDRHHTNPQLVNCCRGQPSKIAYQPIYFVSNLAKLVSVNPFSSHPLNTLFQLGLRLAVLLTYDSCLAEMCSYQNLKPVTRLEEIILGWSTSNCVAVFHLEEQTKEPSPPPPPLNPSTADEGPMEDGEPLNTHEGTTSENGMPVAEPQKPDEPQPAVDDLVKELCPEYNSVESAIDGLINKVYKTVTEQLNPDGIGCCLLKSVAPPDWFAMLVARIAVNKI